MAIPVTIDNFVRAETDRMFSDLQRDAGGINIFNHNREPASVDHQTVIRLNRDTLYSFLIADLTQGATLTLPDSGRRYLSAMIVNEDHYVNAIFHQAGTYQLRRDRFDTDYVCVAIRILVDPNDPEDVAAVCALQDRIAFVAQSSEPFVSPEYDQETFDDTRKDLLSLARHLSSLDRTFGRKDEVDQVRHLVGTAAGWGGLPSFEATYFGADPPEDVGARSELTVGDVPVDGFWSISVYNAQGFFEPNESGEYSINSITGVKDRDGSITVRFGDYPDGTPNRIPTPSPWNYLVRLYRPRADVLDGTWKFPTLQ